MNNHQCDDGNYVDASPEQLFANVLANAAQASPDIEGVVVSISAEGAELVAVTISDRGVGMAPDVLARAGEPLFSTKPEGTGLGLAISRRILQEHGGSIAVRPSMPQGTVFVVKLPAIKI